MRKFLFTLFLCVSLVVTSVMAWDCCREETGTAHTQEASKSDVGHKALAGHHCACQHVMADRITPPISIPLRVASISQSVPTLAVIYRSVAQAPLLEPPLHA